MRDDINNRTDLDRRNTGGMGRGTIAAIIAALVIVGALFMWGPWSSNTSDTAANPAPARTIGQSSSAPVTTTPTTPASPPAAAAPSTADSPATPAPTTR
jgi:hypothetical protein